MVSNVYTNICGSFELSMPWIEIKSHHISFDENVSSFKWKSTSTFTIKAYAETRILRVVSIHPPHIHTTTGTTMDCVTTASRTTLEKSDKKKIW